MKDILSCPFFHLLKAVMINFPHISQEDDFFYPVVY